MCDFSEKLTPELVRLAEDRGFVVSSFKGDPFQREQHTNDDIVFFCKHCCQFHCTVNISDRDLKDQIAALHCPCSEETECKNILLHTRREQIAWCYDTRGIFSNGSFLDALNGVHIGKTTLQVSHGIPDIYFSRYATNEKDAYLFIAFQYEADTWMRKYLLLRVDMDKYGTTWPITIHLEHPLFYSTLHDEIKKNIALGSKRRQKLTTSTFNAYVRTYNALFVHDMKGWASLGALYDLKNIVYEHCKVSHNSVDPHFDNFLKTHTCPVCSKLYSDTETNCMYCRFDGINRVFINQEEATRWKEDILLPYKRMYEEIGKRQKET